MPRVKGQFSYKPTKADIQTVKNLCLVGRPLSIIARCCGTNGIDQDTLKRHYSDIIDNYADSMIGRVADSLMRKAIKLDTTRQIFIMKCRGRRRENPTLDEAITQVIKRVDGVKDEDVEALLLVSR